LKVRCFAHVADVVRGILDLMACPAAVGRVFNLGSDQGVTIRELAERVVGVVDPSVPIEHIAYAKAYAPGFEDIRHRVPDLSRIRAAVGYRPRFTLDDIIREVVGWKRERLAQPS
jgi:UDP-glucose 4-epimerase